MFDIGFWEIAIIGVVALLVIGPERLPSVAKTVGQWMGKTKQFVNHVQSDIKQELGKADELKKLLEEQASIKEVHEIIEQTVSDTKKIVSVGADLDNHAIKSYDDVEIPEPTSRSVGSADAVVETKVVTKVATNQVEENVGPPHADNNADTKISKSKNSDQSA